MDVSFTQITLWAAAFLDDFVHWSEKRHEDVETKSNSRIPTGPLPCLHPWGPLAEMGGFTATSSPELSEDPATEALDLIKAAQSKDAKDALHSELNFLALALSGKKVPGGDMSKIWRSIWLRYSHTLW